MNAPAQMMAMLLLGITVGSAVPRVAAGQSWGITAGMSSSDMDWGKGVGRWSASENRRLPTVGLATRFPVASGVAVQPELHLTGKGYRSTQPSLSLTYLELSVPLRLTLGGMPSSGTSFVRPVISAGASVAVLVSCARSTGTPCGQELPWGDPMGMRPFDAGLLLGVGVERKTRAGARYALEFRYDRGMRDVDHPVGRTFNRTWFTVLQVFPAPRRAGGAG